MLKPNPFTPKSGWEPKIFAGRKSEFEFLEKKLEEAQVFRSSAWEMTSCDSTKR